MNLMRESQNAVSIAVKTLCLTATLIVLSYALLLLTRVFLFDQFITPTESMMPTLMPGDRIIVNKTLAGSRIYSDFDFKKEGGELKSWRTRGSRKVMPNDIVVFNFPHHGGKINFVINNVYAKRCIGIPGDSISIADGFFRNSNYTGVIGLKRMQEDFRNMPDSIFPRGVFSTMPWDGHLPWTIKDFGPLYLPRKGDYIQLTAKEGCIYRMILEWETGKQITFDWDKNEVYADVKALDGHVFNHNYYFMCGDNVSNSNDSRYWGLVPEEYIVGIADRISYSVDKRTGKYRKERFFKKPD